MKPEALERATLRKVAWKIIPFLCALYVFNILDRANVGFARLRMQDDLGMGEEMFNLGYGLFYIGYLLFEVPSNLLLRRVGARRWIARIMISWGAISCLTMFVYDATSFYLMRILLGVAEAGFFPGIIFYLSYWFPDRERAKMTAYFMVAIAAANIVGNPINGLIMERLDSFHGLHGWQWMFLLEGIPSMILGIIVLFKLTDRPEQADWLAPDQRTWLVERMQQEQRERLHAHGAERLGALLNGRVWLLIAIYFTVAVGSNAGGAYFPKKIGERFEGSTPFQIGLLTALPHLCAAVGMVLFSVSSDRSGNRRGHVALAALIGAAGWSLSALAPTPAIFLAGFCLAQLGMMSMLPTFWALPTSFLSGAAAAGGIALINSVANIGGFLGANILGKFGLWSMAVILLAGAALTMCVRQDQASDKSTDGADSGA